MKDLLKWLQYSQEYLKIIQKIFQLIKEYHYIPHMTIELFFFLCLFSKTGRLVIMKCRPSIIFINE